jgi:hypothetical protein
MERDAMERDGGQWSGKLQAGSCKREEGVGRRRRAREKEGESVAVLSTLSSELWALLYVLRAASMAVLRCFGCE